MTEEEIRTKYERTGGNLGKNDIAINRFINMLNIHSESNNPQVKSIAENFAGISKLAPNFTIFQTEKIGNSYFMKNFNALQIDIGNDDLTLSHEFGHAVLGIINDTEVPENFPEIIKNAKQHALSSQNKEKFKNFIKYLSDSNQETRTAGEKGPVSDIISSIFQYPALTLGDRGITCVLPSYHTRDYYYDEEKGEIKHNKVFDEDFANFYALTAHNCEKELEELRELFGEEWMQTMESQLELASQRLELVSKQEIEQKTSTMEAIKDTILNVPKSKIPSTLTPNIEKISEIAYEDNKEEK